jgi:hypothetical protein
METKICNKCKLPKSINEFGFNKRKKDGRQPYCLECARIRDKEYYATSIYRRQQIATSRVAVRDRNRNYILSYLLDHPCVDCGEFDPLLLDFDHTMGKKEINIATAVINSWALDSLQEEIKKCEIRCVRCHRIKTAKEQGWYNSYRTRQAHHKK